MSYCATNCGFFASPNSSYCTVCAKRVRPVGECPRVVPQCPRGARRQSLSSHPPPRPSPPMPGLAEPVAQASFPSPAAAPPSAPPPPPPAGGGGGMAVEAEQPAASSSSSSSASVGGVGGASAAAAASSAASSSAAAAAAAAGSPAPPAGAGAAGAGAPAAAAAAMGGGSAAAAAAAAPPPGPALNPRRCPVMKDGKQCPVKRGLTSFSCNCGLSGLCGAHRYSDQVRGRVGGAGRPSAEIWGGAGGLCAPPPRSAQSLTHTSPSTPTPLPAPAPHPLSRAPRSTSAATTGRRTRRSCWRCRTPRCRPPSWSACEGAWRGRARRAARRRAGA